MAGENNAQIVVADFKRKNIDYIDIKSGMAWYGASKLFGQGIVLDSDNPQIQKYLWEGMAKEKFEDRLIQICKDTNYFGRTIIVLDRFEDGHIGVSYCTNEIMQIVSKIEVRPYQASLLMRKAVGFVVGYMLATYTTTHVYRNVTYEIVGQTQTAYVPGVSEKLDTSFNSLPKDFKLPNVEYHGLGFVPIVEIANKPATNIINTNGEIATLADDFNVRYMAEHINHGLRQMLKEEELGKTRGYGRIAESTLDLGTKTGQSGMLSDYFIETVPLGGEGKAFEVEAGTYDGMKGIEPTQRKINLYFMASGYSPPFRDSAQVTEAETLYSKDLDQMTLKIKRRRYTEFLTDLFKRLLIYVGLMDNLEEEAPFTLEIKESVVYNKLQLSEFIVYNIQNALMTRAEAIALQRDININEAESVIKEIDKDQEDIYQKQSANMDMENLGEGRGQVDKEADPKGEGDNVGTS